MRVARRILVLFAHPVVERSRVGRRLAVAASEIANVTVHDLYERYPRFNIDVVAEQKLLAEHDVLVWQHPFYWYSVPSLLKEWADLVLEYGWAYGDGGDALRNQGKLALTCVTTGCDAETYAPDGVNRFSMRTLLSPWEQTATLCGYQYLAPFVVHGSNQLRGAEDLAPHLAAYQQLLAALRDDELDLDLAGTAATTNSVVGAGGNL